jgi:hypothetical protein
LSNITTLEAIDAAIEKANPASLGRTYLGGSQLGDECERKLWYSFFWAIENSFEPRTLRIFDRGHREEPSLIGYLEAAGIEVKDLDPKTKEQFAVSFAKGHGGGHFDGIMRGLPEAPDEWHIAEFKTSKNVRFKELIVKDSKTKKTRGVEVVKPVHFAQMQIYMHLADIKWAAYIVVNKDDDNLYFERVPYNETVALQLLAKADRIIGSDRPLAGISKDPSFFKCKWCDYQPVCQLEKPPAVNCRTCAHVSVEDKGKWSCATWNKQIPDDFMRKGCDKHLFNPHLIEDWAEPIDAETDFVRYVNKKTGAEFVNGPGGYSSAEISASEDVAMIGSPEIDALKEQMDGTLVG